MWFALSFASVFVISNLSKKFKIILVMCDDSHTLLECCWQGPASLADIELTTFRISILYKTTSLRPLLSLPFYLTSVIIKGPEIEEEAK
jgi:hypothetical protein